MKTTIRKTFSKMTARTAAILPAFLVASGELGGMATAKDFLVVQLEENRTPIGFGQAGDNP